MKEIALLFIIIFVFFAIIFYYNVEKETIEQREQKMRQESCYNENDVRDFSNGVVFKFELVQFKQVWDEKTLKEFNINGSYFLFMGSVKVNNIEENVLINTYYAYLKDEYGAIYSAEIPASKVRIYEDAEVPCIVVNDKYSNTWSRDDINHWQRYNMFNLHVPKGTIIPKLDLNLKLLE